MNSFWFFIKMFTLAFYYMLFNLEFVAVTTVFLSIQDSSQNKRLKTVLGKNPGSLNQLGFNEANHLEPLHAAGVVHVHIFSCISGFVWKQETGVLFPWCSVYWLGYLALIFQLLQDVISSFACFKRHQVIK